MGIHLEDFKRYGNRGVIPSPIWHFPEIMIEPQDNHWICAPNRLWEAVEICFSTDLRPTPTDRGFDHETPVNSRIKRLGHFRFFHTSAYPKNRWDFLCINHWIRQGIRTFRIHEAMKPIRENRTQWVTSHWSTIELKKIGWCLVTL